MTKNVRSIIEGFPASLHLLRDTSSFPSWERIRRDLFITLPWSYVDSTELLLLLWEMEFLATGCFLEFINLSFYFFQPTAGGTTNYSSWRANRCRIRGGGGRRDTLVGEERWGTQTPDLDWWWLNDWPPDKCGTRFVVTLQDSLTLSRQQDAEQAEDLLLNVWQIVGYMMTVIVRTTNGPAADD